MAQLTDIPTITPIFESKFEANNLVYKYNNSK